MQLPAPHIPQDTPERPFASEHRYIRTATADTPKLGPLTNHFYIADPRGRLVLTYDKETQSNGMLRDLRKLLKVANG